MRYCLPCKAEYEDDYIRCPDCGSRTMTVDERDAWYRVREELTQEEFVPVHVFDGPVDKAIITELFSDEGVPWVVHGHTQDPLGSAYTAQRGWGVLMVIEDDLERARELIAQYEDSVVLDEGPPPDDEG